MNDELLARFLVDREPRLYEQLAEAYRPLVASVCRRYLRDPADVDDAVQETFLKLSLNLSRIRGHVSGWLTSAACTTSLNLIRSATRQRRRRTMLAQMGSAHLENQLLHDAIGQRMQEALLQLDATSRQLIISRFFEQMPLRIIAGKANLSLATASRRIAQALADLAAVLRDMGIESTDDLTLAEHFGAASALDQQVGIDDLRFAPDWRAAALHPGNAASLLSQSNHRPGWTRPLRVGVFLSHYCSTVLSTRGLRSPPEDQAWAARLLRDPGLQLISIVESGTSILGPIERTVRDYELLGGLIEATDLAALKTLDVIMVGNQFAILPAVSAALVEAVESGVGLLKDFWCGWVGIGERHADVNVSKLLLAASPVYSFHTPNHCGEIVRAVVETEHPLLPGLRRGSSFSVSGCSPLYQVIPSASVPVYKDHWISPEQHGIPGAGALRPPAFIVGALGKGRVVVIHGLPALLGRLGLGSDYFSMLLTWLAELRRQ